MWLYREPKLQIINFQREKLEYFYLKYVKCTLCISEAETGGGKKYPTPELKKQKIGNAFPALESNLFFSCKDLWYLEHFSHLCFLPDPENSATRL